MRQTCALCGEEISPFEAYYLREPDHYDEQGVVVERGKTYAFCKVSCIFQWGARVLQQRKKEAKKAV